MASMNIKADPTIVSAARGAAMAGVPFSMAGMYDGLVKEYGDLMDNISDNFQKNLTNINSVNSEVKGKIKELQTRANDGTLPLEERQALEKEIQGYRDRLKEIKWGKKGKKERDQLEYDLNKVLAKGKKEGEFATDLIDTFNDDALYDASMVGLGPMKLIEGFVDDKNGKLNPNFKKYKNKDDEWEYSMDYEDANGTKQTIFGTIEDMQGMLDKGKKDNEAVVSMNERIFNVRDEAKTNRNLTFDQVKNTISNDAFTIMSSSPNAYRTMISTRIAGQSQSFIESVHNPDGMMPEIMNSIIATKPELDKNTDGILNVEDFKDEGESNEKAAKDFETFKNMLTNPDAQNKDLVYRIAADFIATQEGEDAFKIGKGNRKVDEDNTNKWSGLQDNKSYQVGGKWVKGLDLTSDAQQIERLASGDASAFTSWNNKEVRFDGTNWTLDGEPSSRNQVVDAILGSKIPSMFEKVEKNDVIIPGEEEEKDEKSWWEIWK